MSVKPFECFLTEQLLNGASVLIEAGHRYQFKSPNEENSLKLYNSVVGKSTHYLLSPDGIELPYIQCAHLKIVPVLHSELPDENGGCTENFIVKLRDDVSEPDNWLSGCALLAIHNSNLESLTNNFKSLSLPGQVWSSEQIKNAIRGLIDLQDNSKDVSFCLLEDQFEMIKENKNSTMFGFESLYYAVSDGDLKFRELGMFEDPLVIKMSGNLQQIKKRLEENRVLFSDLNFEVEQFNDQLHERLKTFSEKFINDNFVGTNNWLNLEYQCFIDEKKKNSIQSLVLIEEMVSQGVSIIARSRSETKAGQRERHILVEADEGIENFELKIVFQGASDLDKSQFKITTKSFLKFIEPVSTRNSLKQSAATLKLSITDEPTYFNISLKRENKSEVYNFRCLILRKGYFYIDSFRNSFIIEPVIKRITLATTENKLQINEKPGDVVSLVDAQQSINVNEYSYVDFDALANESDEVDFSIFSQNYSLNFKIEGVKGNDTLQIPLLLSRNRSHKLFKDQFYGEFNSQRGRVSLENSEFIVAAMRLKLLRWEEAFVSQKIVSFSNNNQITLDELANVDSSIHYAYKNLFVYLDDRKTTPSLVSWGTDFVKLVSDVIDSCLIYFDAIPTGSMLTKEQKIALKIGMVSDGEEEYISPYHPLILAYYYKLCMLIHQDDSYKSMPDVTFERLAPKGLLPYIYHQKHGFSYNQQIKENSFWIQSVPHEKSSLTFVRKLVKEKIDEFQSAFHQLFSGSERNIIINAVNQEQAGDIFLGLVDHIKGNLDFSSSIHVNLYDEDLSFNAFDRFSEADNYDEIKEWLGLNKGKLREVAGTIIEVLRTNLTYSKFTNAQSEKDGQKYAHLTFFRNNDRVDCTDVSIDDMASGIACDGLLAGEASESKSGSYFTGFGLRGTDYNTQTHLRMAKMVGSLLQPALRPNTQYHGANAIALAVSEDFKVLLRRSYESSIWTTIIDPKVTLDFFQSNEDVVLIHYSDQYTSSASYDAITVTAHRGLFERILQNGDGGKINEFNAFNGDWLLKMLSTDENRAREIKEKKGIVGAYKFATSLVYFSDIKWVPLSVAEMIRVSGNIGLKMTDSDFSRNVHGYTKGEISDDVLLVGFAHQQLILLPVEVKTGALPNYTKAVQQAKELRRYLIEDILGKINFVSKLYRGLFIRQVLIQIDKYRLYNVFDENYFDDFLSSKEEWLKGDYSLATLLDYPEGFVISHLEGASYLEPEYKYDDGILKIDLPMGLLKNLVDTPLKKLLSQDKISKVCHVPEKFILSEHNRPITLTIDEEGVYKENVQASTPVEMPKPLANFEGVTTLDTFNSELALQPESIPEQEQEQEQEQIFSPENKTDAESKLEKNNTNFLSAENNPLTVVFGHNALTKAPLNWEPTNTAKFMNTNTGIIGTMGTGKTQFTKSAITQIHRNQDDNVNSAPIGVLIFDYKSDYVDEEFIAATSGIKFKLHKLPYNPLSLFGDTPMLPVHTARGFSETMGKAFNLGQKQQLRLRKLVGEAYDLAGIHKADSGTWHKPAPTIADVWSLFIETEPDEDSLYAALESLYELEIFEEDNSKCKSLYELVDGITVVELAGYPGEIQNLVVALTLDLFYSQMQKKGKPDVQGDFRQITKMILVDEADNFMSQNFPSLRKVLKEGREYGVGIILSTQDITHFQTGENDYSSYVLTWIVHRVSKLKPQDIKAIFSINDKVEQEKLMDIINKLEKHFSLYIDGAKKVVKMRDVAFWELQII